MKSSSRDTGDVESGFDVGGSRRSGEVAMRRVVAQKRRDRDPLKMNRTPIFPSQSKSDPPLHFHLGTMIFPSHRIFTHQRRKRRKLHHSRRQPIVHSSQSRNQPIVHSSQSARPCLQYSLQSCIYTPQLLS